MRTRHRSIESLACEFSMAVRGDFVRLAICLKIVVTSVLFAVPNTLLMEQRSVFLPEPEANLFTV